MHPREFKDNDLFLTKKEAFAIDDERRRLIQENEKLTSQLRKIDRELSMLKYKESESFDRTASHMAGEYVSYPAKEPTDELNSLKKENKFFKEILSEMDKQVYNIEFLKQPMQILENGQIVPVFKELTDEEVIKVYEDMLGVASAKDSAIDFARAILRKAQQK